MGAIRASGTALLLVGEALLAVVGVGGRRRARGSRAGSATGRRPACGEPAATASTGRNCSCEDLLIASRTSCVGISGMLTTMLRSPWVVTSAPDTPPASTRCTMMSRAWLSCSVETLWPAAVFGSRMIWVPPSRSRPSLGVGLGVGEVDRAGEQAAEHEHDGQEEQEGPPRRGLWLPPAMIRPTSVARMPMARRS